MYAHPPLYRMDVTGTVGGATSRWCIKELSFYDVFGHRLETKPSMATAETEYAAEYAAGMAFDEVSDDGLSEYCSSNPTGWLQYQFPSFESQVISYAVQVLPEDLDKAYDPRDWTLKESLDGGATWTQIDKQNGHDWDAGETKTFSLLDSLAGPLYRLDVEKSHSQNTWCIQDLSFYDMDGELLLTDPELADAETELDPYFYNAGKAFDAGEGTIYCSASNVPKGWLQYQFARGIRPMHSYSIKIGTNDVAPKTWKMLQSLDGGDTWRIISNEDNYGSHSWGGDKESTFKVKQIYDYPVYKVEFEFHSPMKGDRFVLDEIVFLDSDGEAIPTDPSMATTSLKSQAMNSNQQAARVFDGEFRSWGFYAMKNQMTPIGSGGSMISFQYQFQGDAPNVAAYELVQIRDFNADTDQGPQVWNVKKSLDGGISWIQVDKVHANIQWYQSKRLKYYTDPHEKLKNPIYRLDVDEIEDNAWDIWCIRQLEFYDEHGHRMSTWASGGTAETNLPTSSRGQYNWKITNSYQLLQTEQNLTDGEGCNPVRNWSPGAAFDMSSQRWGGYCSGKYQLTGGWLQFQGLSKPITSYKIRFGDDEFKSLFGPKSWRMLQSRDGGKSWAVIDEQTDQTNWGIGEVREFTPGVDYTHAPFIRMDVTEFRHNSENMWCMNRMNFKDAAGNQINFKQHMVTSSFLTSENRKLLNGNAFCTPGPKKPACAEKDTQMGTYDFQTCSFQGHQSWVQYQLPAGTSVSSYEIQTHSWSSKGPTAWQIQQSLDGGATWVVLDDRSGIQESDIGSNKWLDLGVEQGHVYRITVSEINGAGDAPHGLAKGDEKEDASQMADHEGEFKLDKGMGVYWVLNELSFYGADGVEVETQPSFAMAETESSLANDASKAFDGGDGYYRSDEGMDGWLQIQVSSTTPITSYKLKSVGVGYIRDRYSPASWTMTKSVDNGLTWSTVDTRSGILTWDEDEEKAFALPVPESEDADEA
jgi:hypothetical protein